MAVVRDASWEGLIALLIRPRAELKLPCEGCEGGLASPPTNTILRSLLLPSRAAGRSFVGNLARPT